MGTSAPSRGCSAPALPGSARWRVGPPHRQPLLGSGCRHCGGFPSSFGSDSNRSHSGGIYKAAVTGLVCTVGRSIVEYLELEGTARFVESNSSLHCQNPNLVSEGAVRTR